MLNHEEAGGNIGGRFPTIHLSKIMTKARIERSGLFLRAGLDDKILPACARGTGIYFEHPKLEHIGAAAPRQFPSVHLPNVTAEAAGLPPIILHGRFIGGS
jgi:hypothetical protein